MTTVTSEARISWTDLEEIDEEKFSNISLFAQGSLDNALLNYVSNGMLYNGMGCAAKVSGSANIATLVTVQPGMLLRGGRAYPLRDARDVDVSRYINQVPDSSKTLTVIIAVDGQEQDTDGDVTFLDQGRQPADPGTTAWPTTQIETALMTVRYAVPSPIGGAADVQPNDPAVSPLLCPIARVTIGVGGVQAVEPITDNLVTPLDQLMLQVAGLLAFEAAISAVVDAVKGNVSTLASDLTSFKGATNTQFARLFDRITAVEQKLSAPQALLRGVDFFTDLSQTDTTVAGYAAAISQGLRFPPGTATNDIPIVPQQPTAGSLQQGYPGYVIPAFDEVVGAESLAFAGVTKYVDRIFWNAFLPYGVAFSLRGFAIARIRWGRALYAVATDVLISQGDPNFIFPIQPADLLYDAVNWGDWRVSTVELRRAAGFWRDLAARGYWTRILPCLPSGGVSVLVQAVTFPGAVMMTSIDLGIERVGKSAGDVRLVVTKSVNGAPDAGQAIADMTVLDAAITGSFTRAKLPLPTLVKPGETVHVHVFHAGGHRIRILRNGWGGVFGGPIRSWSGTAWIVLAGGVELAMRINVARFRANSTNVPLNQLGLIGGIDTVDISASALVPEGCGVAYEARIGSTYVPIDKADPAAHPLAGRPENLPVNMVLGSTTSVAPIVDLSSAKARVSRAGSALQHSSATRFPAQNVGTVVEAVVFDNFNAATQAVTARLRSGVNFATLTPPSLVVDAVQPDGSLLRTWTWTGLAGVAAHKVDVLGTTTDTTSQPTGRQASWYATT